MSLGTTIKDPADVINVDVKFDAFLDVTETITGTPTWTTSPAGPTFGTPTVRDAGRTTRCKITGGTHSTTYTITVTVVTTEGQTIRRSFSLQVANQ